MPSNNVGDSLPGALALCVRARMFGAMSLKGLRKSSGKPCYKLAPLTALSERHLAIIGAFIYGIDGQEVGLEDVAKHFKVRQRYVTHLLGEPLVKAELARQSAALRASYAPGAIRRIGNIALRSEDERNVISAGKLILGEDAKASVNVAVQVNNQLNTEFRPGYVIRLPASSSQSEPRPASPILDHAPQHPDPHPRDHAAPDLASQAQS